MPQIYDHTHHANIPAESIPAYLAERGVHYEFWPVDSAPDNLRRQDRLTPEEQQQILSAFHDSIARLSQERGYISHDLIVLNPHSTANLEELLKNFERTHIHTEDEVRFIVDGEGIFTLTRNGDTFSVTVQAGDLISVPEGTPHYFTLTEVRNVKAVRLFQTKEGWVAIYQDEESVNA